MEKWVLVARINCFNRSREDEFNDWYDKVHVLDVMGTPGFMSAARFVNPDPSSWESGKYLAIYQIETEDISQTIATVQANAVQWWKQGRMSELIIPVSLAYYRQISSFTK